ncbi:hypothetical protein A6A08_14130 [Nocardiopsis sp. TSRI0078]|uniref:hypothetical protein n=1 Tax=unclassified Nocardiopsis TaxID=2649073 RepID=UPI00093E3D93|nr:hypothetical protein [Nocardiopsis sp. TSRI0078]OKI13440.1 hypothetical protein A6A08_14130 [Nocardiopsis sp. TSRI0078]
MAWDRGQDDAQYEAARLLEQLHHPWWWVLWGPGSRRFFAFHLGPHHVAPLSAATPHQLDEQIRATGREAQPHRGQ